MEWRIGRLHFAFSDFFRVSRAAKHTERLVKIPGALIVATLVLLGHLYAMLKARLEPMSISERNKA